MSETETKEAPKAKAAKPVLSLEEKRKRRKTWRSERRKTLSEKIAKDAEFKKTFFAAKKARALARVTAFKKAISGKK